MARSSGGGSRSGGPRSSSSSHRSSSSHGGGGGGIRTSKTPFYGARRFRYYRHGQPYYIYSDTDLRRVPDSKPRWFLILFYIPFIIAIIAMAAEVVSLPVSPMVPSSAATSMVLDTGDVFTDAEEEKLEKALSDFTAGTGIVTQIVTVEWDEWQKATNYFSDYALSRYYTRFSDERCWLLAYSELNGGITDWEWEGIQGDDTIDAVDVFIDGFNTGVQAALISSNEPDPATAFLAALHGALDDFQNQTIEFHFEMLFPFLFTSAFIAIHAYLMIFAGTNRKYSNSELEEVTEEHNASEDSEVPLFSSKRVYCKYCGCVVQEQENGRCPNCGGKLDDK